MIVPFRQNWKMSTLPFSISLYNRVNTGGSFDTPSGLVANQAAWARRGFQGYGPRIQYPATVGRTGMDGLGCNCGSHGLGGLTFDGTGLFGTGLFSGDISTWGIEEGIAGLIGAYAVYSMFFQAKQTKYRLEGAAQRRRKSKAAKYRARAARLEAKGFGGVFA